MQKMFFDASDINHLIERFNVQELRKEKRAAENHLAVSMYLENNELGYWQDYLAAVNLALDIISIKTISETNTESKPQIDIDEIKHRNDIVSIVSRYVELRRSGSRYYGRCPMHEDKHPSLCVYSDNQSWHCFQCNKGGDVVDFIKFVENTDFKGACQCLDK